MLEKTKPENLILDLRHNNGGNTLLYPELLRTLIAFSREPGNQIYALIGRRSYSATGNFVTDLERLADPIFVGEASSECCNLHGDPTYVKLPYSKVEGELTAVKWNLSSPSDRRREMSPEVPVQLTAKAYFAGEDPAMESIFRLIAVRKRKLALSPCNTPGMPRAGSGSDVHFPRACGQQETGLGAIERNHSDDTALGPARLKPARRAFRSGRAGERTSPSPAEGGHR